MTHTAPENPVQKNPVQKKLALKNPALLKQTCLFGLQQNPWQPAKDAKSVPVNNPFTGEKLADVPALSAEEISSAITASETAQTAWAMQTAAKRSRLLLAWADLIDENKADLASIMTAEQGKPLAEAAGEIAYANSFIRWFAEEGKRIYGDVIPAKASHLRYTVLKQPVGVCAAITPWNFPAAMITRKVAPALAAGCSMVVKPATETPLSALALGELALQAGIPQGVLQIVTGSAQTIGSVLTADERVRKLSFTGSTQVGRKLMAQCAPTLKKLSMELGGNAPFIVFADADIEAAATGLVASKFRNAGQTCICANRVYVHESIKEAFLAAFIPKVTALKVGNGADEGVHIGALINAAAIQKTQALLDDALQKGANLVLGGEKHAASDLSFMPTVLTDISQDMHIAHEEIFAPIAPVFTFSSEADVLAMANATEYGLAAYFYTQDHSRAWRVTEGLDYGMIGHNTGMISNEVAPFGGIKQSGFGREGSKYGIEEYLDIKYWCSQV